MSIAIIILMLMISAFFSGTEIAYLSADKLRIALKKQQGSRRGKIVVDFLDTPSIFLGTMLVGNNIALVIFGNLMEGTLTTPLQTWLPEWMTGELGMLLNITIISTIIVLIFGEFIPKIIFRLFATNIMLFFTYVHLSLRYALAPLVVLMVKTSEFLLEKLLKVNVRVDEQVFTRLDLIHFIRNNSSEQVNTEMFEKAIALNQVRVKHCLIHRKDIKAIDVNASVEDLMRTFMRTRFSRIIVFDKTLDNIVGYVHHLPLLSRPASIQSILFDITAVSPDMPTTELMNVFIKNKTTIAYVQEKGKTIGIITLEDILEEVFGEIEDEHDLNKT